MRTDAARGNFADAAIEIARIIDAENAGARHRYVILGRIEQTAVGREDAMAVIVPGPCRR